MKLKELYSYLDFIINGIDMEGYDKEKAHEELKQKQFAKWDKALNIALWVCSASLFVIAFIVICRLGGKI